MTTRPSLEGCHSASRVRVCLLVNDPDEVVERDRDVEDVEAEQGFA